MALFAYAPLIAITVHPIHFGSGEWTTATSVMTGTFTKPMPTGNGTFIQTTGKEFALPMATSGHWTNGRMDHEWLFCDSNSS